MSDKIVMSSDAWVELRKLIQEVAHLETGAATAPQLEEILKKSVYYDYDYEQKTNSKWVNFTLTALNGEQLDSDGLYIVDENLLPEHIENGVTILETLGTGTINEAEIDSNEFLYNLSFKTKNDPPQLSHTDGTSSLADCIKSYSFCNMHDLTTVHIPGNIKRIGDHAFHGCKNLKTVTFDSSALKGGYFANHPDVWNTGLGHYAFCDCPELEECSFSGGMNISAKPLEYLFFGCKKLVDIGDINWYTLGEGQFGFTNIETIKLHNTGSWLTEIPDYCFCQNKNLAYLESDQVEETDNINLAFVKNIGKHAFQGCENFKQELTCNNLQTIGSYAFAQTQATLLTNTPEKITEIGESAFMNTAHRVYEWGSLTHIYTLSSESTFGINAKLIKRFTSLTEIPSHCFSDALSNWDLCIPANIQKIGVAAFENNPGINRVYFYGTPKFIGEHAFGGCTKVFPDGIQRNIILDIYCPWSADAVKGAPWGAVDADIHYDCNPDEYNVSWSD